MDSGRLGRVLGVGARQAAKTLVGAVDAATAPNPRGDAAVGGVGPATPTGAADGRAAGRPGAEPVRAGMAGQGTIRTGTVPQAAVPTTGRPGVGRSGVVEGGRRFGRAVWEPTVRLSGVLWLEVTGMFFGIFALIAGGAAWRLRAGMRAGEQHGQFLLAVGMLAMFGYFAVSSFVAASRRARRRR